MIHRYKLIALILILCSGSGCNQQKSSQKNGVFVAERISPEFEEIKNKVVNLSDFPVDREGFILLFDGKSTKGWRGYGKEYLPEKWIINNELLWLNSSCSGEGGTIIFSSLFRDFELEVEWKISEMGNSGIFYMAREIETKDLEGRKHIEPIYLSALEYQILDNINHPDSRIGENGNRQSASLYDIIPANPQNANPAGEWNRAKITVNNGTVVHEQNGISVVRYQLWGDEWIKTVRESKFSDSKWPLAFELLCNRDEPSQQGYIGLQDIGYDVWFRTIRIKPINSRRTN